MEASILSTVFLSVLLAVPSVAQAGQPARSFVAGEVMVTFKPATPAHEAVSKVSSGGSLATLAPRARAIGREIDIPLEVNRVTPSGTVVFTIPASELIGAVEDRLKRSPEVVMIRTTTVDAKDGSAIEVTFKPGTAVVTSKLSATLSKVAGLPLKAQVASKGRLLVAPDLPAITRLAMERLQKRLEIESAQLNHVRRHYRPQP